MIWTNYSVWSLLFFQCVDSIVNMYVLTSGVNLKFNLILPPCSIRTFSFSFALAATVDDGCCCGWRNAAQTRHTKELICHAAAAADVELCASLSTSTGRIYQSDAANCRLSEHLKGNENINPKIQVKSSLCAVVLRRFRKETKTEYSHSFWCVSFETSAISTTAHVHAHVRK